MFQTKITEKIKIYILFFLKFCHYEIMWKNIVKSDRPEMIM